MEQLKIGDLAELAGNNEILDYWVLEFSPKQQCFNTELVRNMLSENVKQLILSDGECADFMVIGIAKEIEQLNTIREKLDGRWKYTTHMIADEEGNPAKTIIHKGGEIEQIPYD